MKTFKDMISESTPEKGSILVVDALNLCFRWKHSKTYTFADDFIKTVKSLAKSYKCDRIVIASDQGSSSYRMAVYDGYKGDRKDKFANQTEVEKQEFEMFFEEFNNTIELVKQDDSLILLRFPKVEADDIAAYLVKHKSRLNISRIWLISSDRDWDLLIQDDVSRFSTVSRKEFTVDNWSEHYDWTQEQHISIKCLQGDSGDSVPGVEGVGPKRALDLVNKYGSAMDLAACMPIPGTQKYIQNVNAFGAENIFRNYELMDLLTYCDQAIGKENCEEIDRKILDVS